MCRITLDTWDQIGSDIKNLWTQLLNLSIIADASVVSIELLLVYNLY